MTDSALSVSLNTFYGMLLRLQNLIILWRVGFFLMLGWRSGRIEDSLGQCPLHAAAKHGHAEVAHRLLEERAATWFRGSSVAQACLGLLELWDAFCLVSMTWSEPMWWVWRKIFWVEARKFVPFCTVLKDAPRIAEDVNPMSDEELTPLHAAAQLGHAEATLQPRST